MLITPRDLAIGALLLLLAAKTLRELLRLNDQARMASEVHEDLDGLPETPGEDGPA